MTSTQSDLTSRLRRRLETDHREIEETAASELRKLGESLRSVANGALRTIEADTAAWTGRMRGMLLRAWLWPLVAGLSLLLSISCGNWGLMHWLSTRIESRLQTLAILSMDIEQARQTLAQLEKTTWRVELREIDGERFVVLPAGSLDYPPWTVGGQPAVKLSSE